MIEHLSRTQRRKNIGPIRCFIEKGRFAAIVFCLPFASTAHASVSSLACVDAAAKRFGHPPALIRALIEIESSGQCATRHPRNADGTYDIGCMGINSHWLPLLHRKFRLTEHDLVDPCTNIHIGAWVLAKNIQTYGDHWRAIGAYNAKSETKRIQYAWKVFDKLAKLQRRW